MKMQAVIALLGLALGPSAFAATAPTTTSTSDVSTWQKLKDGPVSLSLLHETGSSNKKGDFNGYSTLNIAYVGYKFNDNNSIKLENRFTTDTSRDKKGEEKTTSAYWARHVFSYTRSNILTEAENGVGLSATLEGRYYSAHEEKASRKQQGFGRISANFAKTFGKLALSNTLYYANINRISNIGGVADSYIYGVFVQSYSFTDKLSLGVTEELFQDFRPGKNAKGKKGEVQDFLVTVELGYQFTSDFSGWVSTSTSIMTSHDGSTFIDSWHKNLNYNIGVSYTAF